MNFLEVAKECGFDMNTIAQNQIAELKHKLEQVPSYSCGCIRKVDW